MLSLKVVQQFFARGNIFIQVINVSYGFKLMSYTLSQHFRQERQTYAGDRTCSIGSFGGLPTQKQGGMQTYIKLPVSLLEWRNFARLSMWFGLQSKQISSLR